MVVSERWLQGLVALVLAGLLAGCATTRIDWAGRIGNYTYDQAVLEMGPPDRQARLEDGTIVAEWLTRRGYARAHGGFGYGYGYPYSYHPRFYGPVYPAYIDQSPDYFVRLIFGPDMVLRDYRRFTR
jgi:hypothetical protein